jgi:hypothetical protein
MLHQKTVGAVLEHSTQASFVSASQEAVVEWLDEDCNLSNNLDAYWR